MLLQLLFVGHVNVPALLHSSISVAESGGGGGGGVYNDYIN